jgi:hypothetical protein
MSPVPQVEAVGDEADPPDRSERQQSAERTGGRGGHACDHHSHEHGRDGEAAAIQPVGVVGGAGPRPEQDGGGADCGRVQHRPSDACHADPAPFEDERERRSDQERLRPRVGAVVDAGGIAVRSNSTAMRSAEAAAGPAVMPSRAAREPRLKRSMRRNTGGHTR